MRRLTTFTTPSDSDDWDDISCRNRPYAWFELIGNSFTHNNYKAFDLCGACPLLRKCRALAEQQPPKGLIQGGIAWSVFGTPRPIKERKK